MESYEYNNNGDIVKKTDRRGIETTTYDGMNRLTKEQAGGITNEFSYNGIGAVTEQKKNGVINVFGRGNILCCIKNIGSNR